MSCIAGSLLHSLLAAPRKPCFEDCWVCVCRTCHSWTLYDIFLMSKVIKAIFICLVGVQCSVLAAQSCPTLCDPMACSLPGSCVHGNFQARILEWAVRPCSRGSFRPRDQTHISCGSCIVDPFFTTEPLGKPKGKFSSYQREYLVVSAGELAASLSH